MGQISSSILKQYYNITLHEMDATSASSKVDPDILMTVPCSHIVGVPTG